MIRFSKQTREDPGIPKDLTAIYQSFSTRLVNILAAAYVGCCTLKEQLDNALIPPAGSASMQAAPLRITVEQLVEGLQLRNPTSDDICKYQQSIRHHRFVSLNGETLLGAAERRAPLVVGIEDKLRSLGAQAIMVGTSGLQLSQAIFAEHAAQGAERAGKNLTGTTMHFIVDAVDFNSQCTVDRGGASFKEASDMLDWCAEKDVEPLGAQCIAQ
jgi:hypothetical protein